MADPKQPPDGAFNKRHVSGMLKFLEDEEKQAEALATAATYRKMFASRDWESVIGTIREVAEEHPMRVESRRRPARTLTRRPKLNTSQSTPLAAMVNEKTTPTAPPKLPTSFSWATLGHARNQSTPRERWDTLSHSPTTPLSPTPMGSAFTDGGFWEQLTPKTPLPQTPKTAISHPSFSPIVPQDLEAKTAYDAVKSDVDAMARTICANRMSSLSRIDNSDDVPMSLVKPRDQLKAAGFILRYRQLNLQEVIDAELVQKLRALAEKETKMIKQHAIDDRINPSMKNRITDECVEIGKQQRESMRMHVDRRKNEVLYISDEAVQFAWATRIFKDMEQAYEAEDDSGSCCSDETLGYNYSNFLRSIKREASSSSELISMVDALSCTDLTSLRSNGTNSDGAPLSRETTLVSERSSTSPKKPYTPGLRSRGPSFPTSPAHTSRGVSASPRDPSPKKRSLSPIKRLSEIASSKGASQITTHVDKDIPSPPVSPAEKAFRRKGANPVELDTWAAQLKTMEQGQKTQRREGLLFRRAQNTELRIATPHARGESTGSDKSWVCVTASRLEREDAERQRSGKVKVEVESTMAPPPKLDLPKMLEGLEDKVHAVSDEEEKKEKKKTHMRSKPDVENINEEEKTRRTSRSTVESHEGKKHVSANPSVQKDEREDWWVKELERMEGRELERQMKGIERRGRPKSERGGSEESGGDKSA